VQARCRRLGCSCAGEADTKIVVEEIGGRLGLGRCNRRSGSRSGGCRLGLAAGALKARHIAGRQRENLDAAVGRTIGEHNRIRPEVVLQHAKGLAGGFGKVALDVHAPVSGVRRLSRD
jgi:hypothetical protein